MHSSDSDAEPDVAAATDCERTPPPRSAQPGSVPLSPFLAALPSLVGLILAVPAATTVFTAGPEAREPGFMVMFVLALALLASGFSLGRILQFAVAAARWHGPSEVAGPAEDAGETADLDGPPRWLMDAHSLHLVWVLGVSGSLALMGVLGLWSLADGKPSGLEPGWPMVAAGAVVAAGSYALARWTGERWEHHEREHEQWLRQQREHRLADPLARIREAQLKEADETGQIRAASSDSRPECAPSSAGTR